MLILYLSSKNEQQLRDGGGAALLRHGVQHILLLLIFLCWYLPTLLHQQLHQPRVHLHPYNQLITTHSFLLASPHPAPPTAAPTVSSPASTQSVNYSSFFPLGISPTCCTNSCISHEFTCIHTIS